MGFIPLFEIVIYPFLEKMKLNFTSLKKMFAGFVLTGVAFIIAAVLQIQIDVSDLITTKSVYEISMLYFQFEVLSKNKTF